MLSKEGVENGSQPPQDRVVRVSGHSLSPYQLWLDHSLQAAPHI